VKELFFRNFSLQIYPDSIIVRNGDGFKLNYKLPDKNFIIKDACMLADTDIIYIYSILNNPALKRSQLAVFPFSIEEKKFMQPSLDKHDYYDPWKILLYDVDNDGNPELLVGVNKSTRFDEERHNAKRTTFIQNGWVLNLLINLMILK